MVMLDDAISISGDGERLADIAVQRDSASGIYCPGPSLAALQYWNVLLPITTGTSHHSQVASWRSNVTRSPWSE
jgi:hypothetical protein